MARHPPALRSRLLPSMLIGALMTLPVPDARAIEVSTFADENGENPDACSLREAARSINTATSVGGCVFTAGDSLISLVEGTYLLRSEAEGGDRVEFNASMTVQGLGPGLTEIRPSDAVDHDLLFVNLFVAGTVTFEGFGISGARGEFNNAISFLADSGSHLTLRNLRIHDNVADGAAFNIQGNADGTILVERSVFEDNIHTAGGGGAVDCDTDKFSQPPSMEFSQVLFRRNMAVSAEGSAGGGVFSRGCNLVFEGVTFDRNSARLTEDAEPSGDAASTFGGGLAFTDYFGSSTHVALSNVTFVGNSADVGGGMVQFATGAGLTTTLTNVTFADNAAALGGDHLFQNASTAGLRNVLLGPSSGSGCGGNPLPSFTLLGGNMDADGSCGVERTEPDPGLAADLAQQGGFTPTLALLNGAAAVDAGTNNGCPATDQRGSARPFDGDEAGGAVCDVGAYELAPVLVFADGFESQPVTR